MANGMCESANMAGSDSGSVVLILENGTEFRARAFGAQISDEACIIGETVFTTGMTGYIETLTDPSFYGQIVVQTFPLIGNYGINSADMESSKAHLRAYIVQSPCKTPSNFRSEMTLDEFLKKQGVVGLCGIDTRRLTKMLRERGTMNGAICKGAYNKEEILSKLKSYKITDAVQKACGTQTAPSTKSLQSGGKTVVLWDFGAKENIARCLKSRGINVIKANCNTTAAQIMATGCAGVVLSNGPGDPSDNGAVIEEVKKLLCGSEGLNENGERIPIFGICLGHQLMALASGAKTIKLKYGHRGANHSVQSTTTGRIFITSQNHGYAVEKTSLPPSLKVSFVNTNDGTIEGLDYVGKKAFSVQFHPEAAAGPLDTGGLFDKFIEMLK